MRPSSPRILVSAAPEADLALLDAVDDLLPAIEAIDSQNDIKTVIVAANEDGNATTPVALALAAAAAAAGYRVLVAEASGSRAALAAAAVADGEPVLVDLFGELRVALQAESGDGLVTLAPAFREAQRLVAGLARAPMVPLVDDLASVYDLVIVDAGEAVAGEVMIELADAVLRVGAHPSERDDERLLDRIGAPRGAFLGTIAASAFMPRRPVAARVESETRAPIHPRSVPPTQRGAFRAAAPVLERRKIGGRR